MPEAKLTRAMLGVDTQAQMLHFHRKLKVLTGANAANASMQDLNSASILNRPKTDLGLWFWHGSMNAYMRLNRCKPWSDWVSNNCKADSRPKGEMASATSIDYPPAVAVEFAAQCTVPKKCQVLPAHGHTAPATERSSLTFSAVYEVWNHEQAVDDVESLFELSSHPGRWISKTSQLRRFCDMLRLTNLTLLVHPGDPHQDGAFANYLYQNTSLATAQHRTFDSCPLLERAYRHNPAGPLIAVSSAGASQLMFIPSLLDVRHVWQDKLTAPQRLQLAALSKACKSTPSLLMFRLDKHHTIESAIADVCSKKSNWFHGCVHLRWTLQCTGANRWIHEFPQKRKRKRDAAGRILDNGTVALCYSEAGAEKSGKAAFAQLVQPLSKAVQAVLQALPEELCKPVLPEIRKVLDVLGLEIPYVSLNIFWPRDISPSITRAGGNKFWDHLAAKWKRLENKHHGLYLHRDTNNDGWGAVLIFGADLSGFDQRYVTFSLLLPCPGWSLVLGDYRYLLHTVSSGNGLRFSLVLATHQSHTQGVDTHGREVYVPSERPRKQSKT